ncbi:hypothetical protein [Clostridium botulinum]|uniref:Insecticidal crystal toxin domain-containing protein n=1 Tax=Clostridium botulinum TaxID=1491 RepID=A0A9Q1ZA78_CLOBO|nr:hypothetical protein [Clostridium botulinum]AEB76711.1 hypothetical protein CbC4_2044 [Clostridium botulinum BKT015925]KEH98881.1 hypothetical protein Y848_13130 [Clostridium botulinum C/D str. Sp77]KEI00170.1 hypothetical protein Z953_10395 [Clostridium botulinum D str. 16868]KLU76917.1 hypothetical protein CBC3_01145 [Clostridium botulinum V891]KOA73003.1 hypothetical protein ADU78_13615 [Clostridium botulinum]
MKKKAILFMISVFLFCSYPASVRAYDKDLIIPTHDIAVVDGKIKSEINIDKEVSSTNPWMYVDIKLDETKSKQSKYNYAELALKRAIGFFDESRLSLKDGDFYIVLNNGFVINKKNYKDKKVTQVAKKQLLDKDFYRGDTLFKLAFLYHDNKVERKTYWKLIDTIDLPAGSTHTLTKKYTVGISEDEEVDIAQALGIKLIGEAESGIGADLKFASTKLLAKLNSELNSTISKIFKRKSEIKSTFESSTTVSYNPRYGDKIILRYQLVDNYKVEDKAFKDATYKLQELINEGGISIVKVEPTSGEKGIDVPVEKIFDVSLDKR